MRAQTRNVIDTAGFGTKSATSTTTSNHASPFRKPLLLLLVVIIKKAAPRRAFHLLLLIRAKASTPERTRRASSATPAPRWRATALAYMAVCWTLFLSRQLPSQQAQVHAQSNDGCERGRAGRRTCQSVDGRSQGRRAVVTLREPGQGVRRDRRNARLCSFISLAVPGGAVAVRCPQSAAIADPRYVMANPSRRLLSEVQTGRDKRKTKHTRTHSSPPPVGFGHYSLRLRSFHWPAG